LDDVGGYLVNQDDFRREPASDYLIQSL